MELVARLPGTTQVPANQSSPAPTATQASAAAQAPANAKYSAGPPAATPAHDAIRVARTSLELALLGPGHLDGVLGRGVARDDVVGGLVV